MEEHLVRLLLVSKKWRRIFDDQHLLKRLKNGQFPLNVDSPISFSALAKNKETGGEIQTTLGLWLDVLIPKCSQNSPHALFILENIWLNPIHSDLSCPHSKIAEVLKKIKNMQMKCYMLWLHLYSARENLPEKTLKEALRLGYLRLSDIPNNQRTFEIYHIAVLYNGESLESVPENFRTVEICKLQQNGLAFEFVPEQLRTAEICQLAIEPLAQIYIRFPTNP
jgi:hypothetical protein